MNSEIILVKDIKLDKDYVNVLSYNESQMVELCRLNAIASRDDYSFIRVNNNSIYVNFTYSQCLQANYIAFQNKDYSNKWFFAFIDDIEYRNDGNTEIFYTVDAWATWFDKWNKKPCFINRQHVNDDTIGLHTVSENLDIGEVIEEKQVEEISFSEYSWVGILSSYNPATLDVFSGITVYNKQVFGKKLYLIECTEPTNLENLGLFIQKVNSDRGGTGDIDTIFIIPDALINRADLIPYNSSIGAFNFSFYGISNKFEIETFNTEIEKQYSFYDYEPKNR